MWKRMELGTGQVFTETCIGYDVDYYDQNKGIQIGIHHIILNIIMVNIHRTNIQHFALPDNTAFMNKISRIRANLNTL